MRSFFVLFLVFVAASGHPVKELVHSVRIIELSALPDPLESFKVARKNTSNLIFGGIRARSGQFPMQAFIWFTMTDGQEFQCGGSLISATHVLTAAHCTFNLISGSVMVGSLSLDVDSSPHEQRRNISRVFTHRGFDISKFSDDIGVIEVSPPFELNDFVKAVTIVSDDDALFQEPTAVVSGFGIYKTENKMGIYSDDLLFTEVDLFPFSFCNETRNGTLVETQFCAGAAGRGVAFGDSGGPIQVRYNDQLVQIGVTSFGDEDEAEHNQDTMPSVFTRISKYCDFVDEATAGFVKCGSVPTRTVASTIASEEQLSTF